MARREDPRDRSAVGRVPSICDQGELGVTPWGLLGLSFTVVPISPLISESR